MKQLTDGLGAEPIIDFVGEKGAIEDCIAMVRDGGFYYVIAYGENIDIPTIDTISHEISFVGTCWHLQRPAGADDPDRAGEVSLHTTMYPLEAINDAMADLDEARLQGRGILVPAGAA